MLLAMIVTGSSLLVKYKVLKGRCIYTAMLKFNLVRMLIILLGSREFAAYTPLARPKEGGIFFRNLLVLLTYTPCTVDSISTKKEQVIWNVNY